MPKIYSYMGINVSFYSNEHDPIRVHARCGNAVMIVKLYVKDGRVYRVVCVTEKGKFTAAQKNDLRDLIGLFKENIRVAWIDYFINHKHIEPVSITARIK